MTGRLGEVLAYAVLTIAINVLEGIERDQHGAYVGLVEELREKVDRPT